MSDETPKALQPTDFPPEVHESLAELRRAAKAAKSAEEVPRRATPEEIALSETQRKPYHCVAHSSRTGLACEGYRLAGTTLCRVHGQSPALKAKAKERLNQMVPKAVERLDSLIEQSDHLPTALNAVKEVLDRSIGPVRGNSHENSGIQIAIGLLGHPSLADSATVVVSTAQEDGESDQVIDVEGVSSDDDEQ